MLNRSIRIISSHQACEIPPNPRPRAYQVTIDVAPHGGPTVWSIPTIPDPSFFNGANDHQPMTLMGGSFVLRAGSQLESRSPLPPFLGPPPHAQMPAYVASRESSEMGMEAIARNNSSLQSSFGESSQYSFGGSSQFTYGWGMN